MMSGIGGKNTKPELMIRKGLHSRGFRYRIHCKHLPGNPDLCLPRYNAVIFVNGCFWHGHDCHMFRWPKTRVDFWKGKIERNREVDFSAMTKLSEADWRTATVWECALKGKTRPVFEDVITRLEKWLKSDEPTITIEGSK